MKRTCIIVIAALLLLTACGRTENEQSPAAEQTLRLAETAEAEKDGIYLRVEALEDGMLTVRLQNRSSALWYYGESFGLFKRNSEGGWSSVPDGRSWIMIAHELEIGDEVFLSLDLTPLPLESGTYKLVKDGIEVSLRLITAQKDAQ
ncbi:MAG: hypothetical protein J6A79_16225 [Clostridia bacterium]|nr:hypothetical protein [Oscillospiraceae bacterium]MBO5570458.1 hypothetical protein [Clostridia bacterium]